MAKRKFKITASEQNETLDLIKNYIQDFYNTNYGGTADFHDLKSVPIAVAYEGHSDKALGQVALDLVGCKIVYEENDKVKNIIHKFKNLAEMWDKIREFDFDDYQKMLVYDSTDIKSAKVANKMKRDIRSSVKKFTCKPILASAIDKIAKLPEQGKQLAKKPVKASDGDWDTAVIRFMDTIPYLPKQGEVISKKYKGFPIVIVGLGDGKCLYNNNYLQQANAASDIRFIRDLIKRGDAPEKAVENLGFKTYTRGDVEGACGGKKTVKAGRDKLKARKDWAVDVASRYSLFNGKNGDIENSNNKAELIRKCRRMSDPAWVEDNMLSGIVYNNDAQTDVDNADNPNYRPKKKSVESSKRSRSVKAAKKAVNCASGQDVLSNGWVIQRIGRKWYLMSADEYSKYESHLEDFPKDWMVDSFPSKQALIQQYMREPFYKHMFEDSGYVGNGKDAWDSDKYTRNKTVKAETYNRYSDARPYKDRRYWYFTTHGLGPGTIPEDLKVLDTQEGQNKNGTWGTFVLLDGVLNTNELKKYDMTELSPETTNSYGIFIGDDAEPAQTFEYKVDAYDALDKMRQEEDYGKDFRFGKVRKINSSVTSKKKTVKASAAAKRRAKQRVACSEDGPLCVCEHCLWDIESREGRQVIYDEFESEVDYGEPPLICDWCEEEVEKLYQITPGERVEGAKSVECAYDDPWEYKESYDYYYDEEPPAHIGKELERLAKLTDKYTDRWFEKFEELHPGERFSSVDPHPDVDEAVGYTLDDAEYSPDEIKGTSVNCSRSEADGRFQVQGYIEPGFRGLMEDEYFRDFEDAKSYAHDLLMQGYDVRISDDVSEAFVEITSDEYQENFDGEFVVNEDIADFQNEVWRSMGIDASANVKAALGNKNKTDYASNPIYELDKYVKDLAEGVVYKLPKLTYEISDEAITFSDAEGNVVYVQSVSDIVPEPDDLEHDMEELAEAVVRDGLEQAEREDFDRAWDATYDPDTAMRKIEFAVGDDDLDYITGDDEDLGYGFNSNGEALDESTVDELCRIANEILDSSELAQYDRYTHVDRDSFEYYGSIPYIQEEFYICFELRGDGKWFLDNGFVDFGGELKGWDVSKDYAFKCDIYIKNGEVMDIIYDETPAAPYGADYNYEAIAGYIKELAAPVAMEIYNGTTNI